jgi:hypothetical protein
MVVAEVAPSEVTAGFPGFRRWHLVARQPMRDITVIELQAPAHSRLRLPHHHRFFVVRPFRSKRRVKFVGFAASVSLRLCEGVAEIDRSAGVSRASRSLISAVSQAPIVMWCQQAIFVPRRSGRRRAIDDVVLDAILRIGG